MIQDHNSINSDDPIGVFDSGIGGLSVLTALRGLLPHEDFVYFGDTARLPYGTKSRDTVRAYAATMTRTLLDHDIKALVVACNTASAYAMDTIRALSGDIPVIGMVGPAAERALSTTRNGHILVTGTHSTIQSNVYPDALQAGGDNLRITSIPCQLLVALAEEGWHDGNIAEASIRAYLHEILGMPADERPDTMIMGCTHFPVFQPVFARVLNEQTHLINCGIAAGRQLAEELPQKSTGDNYGRISYYATDSPERFAASAQHFVNAGIRESEVTMIDIAT